MPTPQITLRVDKERHARWKAACEAEGTNISDVMRSLMDDWVGLRAESVKCVDSEELSVDVSRTPADT